MTAQQIQAQIDLLTAQIAASSANLLVLTKQAAIQIATYQASLSTLQTELVAAQASPQPS